MFAALFVLASLPVVAGAESCDVAVIGGGIGGAVTAALLKERRYKVCLFEKLGRLGGGCRTVPVTPPAGCTTCNDWLDLGVGHNYLNLTWQNEHKFGQYSFDSAAFFARYVPANKLSVGSYGGGDVDKSLTVNLFTKAETTVASNGAAVGAAMTKLKTILAKYPWLNEASSAKWPDPIPTELLLSVKDFLIQNQLTALAYPVFGELGNLDKLTTLYAVGRFRSGGGAAAAPGSNAAIKVAGGCWTLFEGIQNSLGASAILNAEVLNIWRPNQNTAPIQLLVRVDGDVKTYFASKLIITIPPTERNMAFLQYPSEEEARLFRKVRTSYHGQALIDLEGPKLTGFSYEMRTADPNRWMSIPATPGVEMFERPQGYGPGIVRFLPGCDRPEPILSDYSLLNTLVGSVPPTVATTRNVRYMHPIEYLPHFSVWDLMAHPTPYKRFHALQGQRRTYWVGALFSAAETAKLWEQAYEVISAYFPVKPVQG